MSQVTKRYIAPTKAEYVTKMIENIREDRLLGGRWIYGAYNQTIKTTLYVAYELSPSLFYYFVGNGVPDAVVDRTIDALIMDTATRPWLSHPEYTQAKTASRVAAILHDVDEAVKKLPKRTAEKAIRDAVDLEKRLASTHTYMWQRTKEDEELQRQRNMFISYDFPADSNVTGVTTTTPKGVTTTTTTEKRRGQRRPDVHQLYHRIGLLTFDAPLVMTAYTSMAPLRKVHEVQRDIIIAIRMNQKELARDMINAESLRRNNMTPIISGILTEIIATDDVDLFEYARRFVRGDALWCDAAILDGGLTGRLTCHKIIANVATRIPYYPTNRININRHSARYFIMYNTDIFKDAVVAVNRSILHPTRPLSFGRHDSLVLRGEVIREMYMKYGQECPRDVYAFITDILDEVIGIDLSIPPIERGPLLDNRHDRLPCTDDRWVILSNSCIGAMIDRSIYPFSVGGGKAPSILSKAASTRFADVTIEF